MGAPELQVSVCPMPLESWDAFQSSKGSCRNLGSSGGEVLLFLRSLAESHSISASYWGCVYIYVYIETTYLT